MMLDCILDDRIYQREVCANPLFLSCTSDDKVIIGHMTYSLLAKYLFNPSYISITRNVHNNTMNSVFIRPHIISS